MDAHKELIGNFERLFPEEAYLSDIRNISFESHESNHDFLLYLKNHLAFYEKEYFRLPFEKLYKSALLINYHLQLGERLSGHEVSIIDGWLSDAEQEDWFMNEALAFRFFEDIFNVFVQSDIYDAFGVSLIVRHLSILKSKQSVDEFKNPIKDWASWESNIHSLEVVSKEYVESGLLDVIDKTESFKQDAFREQTVDRINVKRFIGELMNSFGIVVPEYRNAIATVVHLPKYLQSICPSAVVLIKDRITTPSAKVFIRQSDSLSAARFIFTCAHETIGHHNHFMLASSLCRNRVKLVPYLSRFPITEGFALLAEDFVLELFESRHDQFMYLANDFGLNYEALRKEISYVYYRYRTLRYLRYLFEIEVYENQKQPIDVVSELSSLFNYNMSSLREDLFSYLITPGYGSCYIGGYLQLKSLGKFKDHVFRASMGETGFWLN